MKKYHLYVFTQESCPPCIRLKDHLKTLETDEQKEIDFVPLKTSSGERTALAKGFGVELSPTLVVVAKEKHCEQYEDDWFCDVQEKMVESIVGANNIISSLSSTIDAYTYAHPD